MEDPVSVQVMDAVQDLVEQRFDHSPRQLKWLLVGLGCSMELYNVLKNKTIKESLLSIIVCLWKKLKSEACSHFF